MSMRRRDFLASVAAAGVAAAARAVPAGAVPDRAGRIKQAAMRVNFGAGTALTLDDMCREAARIGFDGFELVATRDWPTLRKYGLTPSMAPFAGTTLQDGLIHPERHDAIERGTREMIDLCAANGCPSIIASGGQRRGMSREEGADHCVAILNRVKGYAEDRDVTICLEIMNTKFTDPNFGRIDQVFDHLAWGVGVCERVGSTHVTLLVDLYHTQIMDGDLCDNIRANFKWMGHFHAAGVPGRHELDDTQEINYRFVAQTIAELGFRGFIAHEWRPTPGHDPLDSLRRSHDILAV